MGNKTVSIVYDSEKQFKEIASALKIMADLKEGVPRTAYRGVVKIHVSATTVYVHPRVLPERVKGCAM